MTIRMISKSPNCIYANKRRAVGTEFEVLGKSDARVLAAIGRAEIVPTVTATAPALTAPPAYRTRVVAPETEVAPDADGAAKPKRQYRRRDLTAEP